MTHRRSTGHDVRGVSRLAIDATLALTRLVEHAHHNIARLPLPLGEATPASGAGITGLVYRSIRGVTQLVGGGLEAALAPLAPLMGEVQPTAQREALLAALNGLIGDHLERTGNPLAIPMQWRVAGRPLPLDPAGIAAALPAAGGKVLLMIHGLCMDDLTWCHAGHDHGAALAADAGWTPVYLHYNSGRHISLNGRELADKVAALLAAWPVPVQELAMVGYSMGGLVARSACHYASAAGLAWPAQLGKLVSVGTPHLGAPLEQGGHGIDQLLTASPYTAAFARLGKARSAGITDLRHGALRDEDWAAHGAPAPTSSLPLPAGVACYAVAALLGESEDSIPSRLLGDGLVPLASALGISPEPARTLDFPLDRQCVVTGTGHLGLLASPAVYRRLREWL